MKTSQKGFSVVEIAIVIVVVGLLGAVGWLVYDRQKSKTNDQQASTQTSDQKQEPATQETKANDPYDGWETYADNMLGYAFKYPGDWTVTPVNYEDKLGVVYVDSSDIKTEEWPIGATDVTKGSRVELYPPRSGVYNVFTDFYKQFKDNGTIKPVDLTLGNHKAIEFTFAYEGPESTIIRMARGDSQYIFSSFTSEGQESAHPNYNLYKKLLASIE